MPSLRRVFVCAAVLCAVTPAVARVQWSGGLTQSAFTVAIEVLASDFDSGIPTVVVSTDASLAPVVASTSPSTLGLLKWDVTGLTADTQYYYGIPGLSEVGKVKTAPVQGVASSFTFAFASCAFTGYDHKVFTQIADLDALFFVHMGDLHYEDIAVNSEELRNASFQEVFSSPSQRAMFLSRPTVYTWDDHDFGDNNAKGDYIGKPAAQEAYKTWVPHYPLITTRSDGPLYQGFTIGRVRFLITDLRSDSSLPSDPDSTLGAEQKTWLFNELDAWQSYSMVVWVSSKPWQGTPEAGSDKWRGYPAERTEINDHLANMNPTPTNFIVVAGDAHLLGIDDGMHTDYSTSGGGGFPLFQAAPMAQYGSSKDTGPYVVGCIGYDLWIVHHFASMTVTDDGVSPVSVTMKGYVADDGEVFSYDLTVPFNKTGQAGGSPCTLPLVPGFMWATVALQVTSVVGALTFYGAWVIIRSTKIKHAANLLDKSGMADWQKGATTSQAPAASAAAPVAHPPVAAAGDGVGGPDMPAPRGPVESVTHVVGAAAPSSWAASTATSASAMDDADRFGGTMSVNPIHAASPGTSPTTTTSFRRPTITVLQSFANEDFKAS